MICKLVPFTGKPQPSLPIVIANGFGCQVAAILGVALIDRSASASDTASPPPTMEQTLPAFLCPAAAERVSRGNSLRGPCGVAYASLPSIVPLDWLDREIYLVLEGFGDRAGCGWRETDQQDTDLETILRHLLPGEYTYPLRIVAFNALEGRSRDATSDVADAVAQRAAETDAEVSSTLHAFIDANTTGRFDLQLKLPLRGVALGLI